VRDVVISVYPRGGVTEAGGRYEFGTNL
jgi:hypothetical protein